MELVEVTKEMLERGKKIVIVKFSKTNCLTFLVDDVAMPQVPGYPACSLSYFKSAQKAVIAIGEKYEEVLYTPKHPQYGYFYSDRRR